jgi:hypothetical protein
MYCGNFENIPRVRERVALLTSLWAEKPLKQEV